MTREALLLLAGLLALWQAMAAAGTLPGYLSSPAAVAREVVALVRTGELAVHSAVSLYRSLAGLTLGAGLGIALGLAAGALRPVAGFTEPLVSLTYPVPKVAFLPVLMVWFGISDVSKILLIALSCFFPCYIAALYGIRAVDPLWVWAAQNMGASRARIFLRVLVPGAAVHIFSGLRVALALAFILVLASELVGSSNRLGLGFLILSADAGGRTDLMFAAIVAIAALGFGADRLLLRVRRRLLAGYLLREETPHA
ncbi:MAG: ABC transporter permease [Armatimonadota bacterium]|nr:ABC transporter permease [Armatimonadota bacterium]MDR7532675.1 ABC transporter permease [Armatimonadota bacterium]MDR7536326.1 ABC transporter permease [Armatimonadota bacterium]